MISDAAPAEVYTVSDVYSYEEIAYYDYYDAGQSDTIVFTSKSGHVTTCAYYYFTPKDVELDESTPVVAWVTHGGGVDIVEMYTALNIAASQDNRAIFIAPWTDTADGICAALDAAKKQFEGKGDFDNVSVQGTSSGGRAVIRAALESVNPDADYDFRFGNVLAYDPAEETRDTNITGQTEAMRRLAERGTVLVIQTDSGTRTRESGTGLYCNEYARVYAAAGGTAVIAEINNGSHERKFLKPITHNSIAWGAGCGMLAEDYYYHNEWFYYRDGEKIPSTLEEVSALLHPPKGKEEKLLLARGKPEGIRRADLSPGS